MATKKEAASGLTQGFLLSVLHYDPETGLLTWIDQHYRAGRDRVGQVAGRLHRSGYVNLKIFGVEYAAHRIAWMMVTGLWPERDLDHIDHNRANNKLANLRAATRRQNMMNRSINKGNQSGVKGVWYSKPRRSWMASISVEAHKSVVELFPSKEEAVAWRRKNERQYYGEFAAA